MFRIVLLLKSIILRITCIMKEDFDLMQPKGKHVFIRGHKLCKITTILGDLYNLIIVVNNKNEVSSSSYNCNYFIRGSAE